jgi:hypothetical protein
VEEGKMVKVAAFTLNGYEFVFYPQDHEPQHFHLSQIGERWEIRVLFMLCTPTSLETRPKRPSRWPANYNPLPKNKTRELLWMICQHKTELEAQWNYLQGK